MRKTLLAALFGVILGSAVGPAADFVANSRSYGKDTGAPMSSLTCLQLYTEVLPEISLAKQMGLTKAQYMRYVNAAVADDLSAEQQQKLDQILFYFDQIWVSDNYGVEVIAQCFDRADKQDSAPIVPLSVV